MSTVSTGESILTLTEAAARQVRHLQEVEPQNAGRPLRIYVEKRREGDRIAEWHGVTVVVDSFSADYLRGTMVDFKDGLNDSGFKISNPNAKQNCGCGNSFGV
jgi:Fe-S cluster assembly iron-binding protein IscA